MADLNRDLTEILENLQTKAVKHLIHILSAAGVQYFFQQLSRSRNMVKINKLK